MKTRITIKLKIPYNRRLIETIKRYSKAIQYISNEGFKAKISNRYKLHHLTYYKARENFNLPSQYIINAIRVASQTLKSVKSNKGSKPSFKEIMPLDFDRRTFSFKFDKVKLTTINGRIDIPIEIPEYYWKYLDWSYQTARILGNRGKWFIHITFSRDLSFNNTSDNFLGVDVGINNVAVISNRKFFNSKHIKTIKRRYSYLRARLQSKGTKSSRKLLKKISGRERRFMRQCNHEISKAIISSINIGDTVVMENIKHIRKNRVNKKTRTWLNNWSFYQLQKFIEYKARLKGCNIIYLNPRNTSKTCSRCFSVNTRRNCSDFHCFACNYHLNADLNASLNLKLLGKFLTSKADVNQPYVPNNECETILGSNMNLGTNAQGFSPE